MKTFFVRSFDLERDSQQIAAWFTALDEDDPTSDVSLKEYYIKNRERIFPGIAEDMLGNLVGFYWVLRDRNIHQDGYLHLFVAPELRGRGYGRRLYSEMLSALEMTQIKKLSLTIPDDCPSSRAFAEKRGFILQRHSIAMALDLAAFDPQPYDLTLEKLQAEGFHFTSMEALGNTEEAQRRLYLLNDSTSAETPGSEGVHPWSSFEDFQQSVCQSDWYKPGGQKVVIDLATGDWVAMSAITCYEGGRAYNLFTGVDRRYRGRKLAQAVKVLALRYARDVLGATFVRTHHNAQNLPMIAIDKKLGYSQVTGRFSLEKIIE